MTLEELSRLHRLRTAGRADKAAFAEYDRLMRWIEDIPDEYTRRVFLLRFDEGLTWDAVAARLGGGNSADGVKKTCYRYIERDGGTFC